MSEEEVGFEFSCNVKLKARYCVIIEQLLVVRGISSAALPGGQIYRHTRHWIRARIMAVQVLTWGFSLHAIKATRSLCLVPMLRIVHLACPTSAVLIAAG